MSIGTVSDGGCRVSAQVSISRTWNSGSTAHRSTSLSTNRGSGVVPTASAARSRTDGPALSSARKARMAYVWRSGSCICAGSCMCSCSGSCFVVVIGTTSPAQ